MWRLSPSSGETGSRYTGCSTQLHLTLASNCEHSLRLAPSARFCSVILSYLSQCQSLSLYSRVSRGNQWHYSDTLIAVFNHIFDNPLRPHVKTRPPSELLGSARRRAANLPTVPTCQPANCQRRSTTPHVTRESIEA